MSGRSLSRVHGWFLAFGVFSPPPFPFGECQEPNPDMRITAVSTFLSMLDQGYMLVSRRCLDEAQLQCSTREPSLLASLAPLLPPRVPKSQFCMHAAVASTLPSL